MSDSLIDQVIEQIKKDIDSGDVTALAELLEHVNEKYLKGFLPSGEQYEEALHPRLD